MYTHPAFARQGVGRRILRLCEAAAAREGFATLELMATIAGEPLYAAYGVTPQERVEVATSRGVTIPRTRMVKAIDPL